MTRPVDLLFPEFAELRAKGLCTRCHEPAMPKCTTPAGRREATISGLCEECWDEIFADDDQDGEYPEEDEDA